MSTQGRFFTGFNLHELNAHIYKFMVRCVVEMNGMVTGSLQSGSKTINTGADPRRSAPARRI